MGDPALILLHVQPALLDDADPDVDDVAINNWIPCGVGVRHAREEAEGEGVNTVAGMPVGGHPLVICIAIFRCRRTVVLREPLEHVDEDNVWLAGAPLLEGGMHTNQYGVEEKVREGSIHSDDVSPCFSVEAMFRTSSSTVISVATVCVVWYFVHRKWDWCEGVRIRICCEKSINRAWTRTEKKIHSI